MDSDSATSSGGRSNDRAIGKSLQEIAFEYDDFLMACAPTGREADSSLSSKKNLVEDVLRLIEEDFQRYRDGGNIDHLDYQLRLVDEVFSFHKQSYAASNLDKLELNSLVEKSKMLGQTIKAIEAVISDDDKDNFDKIDFKSIKEDFSNCKNILNDTISTVFKDHSSEVTLLLSELLKNEFNENPCEEYLDLSTEQFSDEVVDILVAIGVIEYHPDDDTQIKLTRFI